MTSHYKKWYEANMERRVSGAERRIEGREADRRSVPLE